MAIEVQVDFIRRGTIRVICYVYDDDGDLADATSVAISIVDPKGTVKIGEADMGASTATGIYEYFYATTSSLEEGDWQILCDVLDGTYHSIGQGHFNLTAGVNE